MSSKLLAVLVFLGLMRALAQTVITLAGGNSSGTTTGSTNGVGTAALFSGPFGISLDVSGNVIVADYGNHNIRVVYPNRSVITLAGGSSAGSNDGIGTAALFNRPYGVAVPVDTSAKVYVADWANHKIRLIYPNLTVITLAGGSSSGTAMGSANGVGTAALFNNPGGIAVDTWGNVFVAGTNNNNIRVVYPNRSVITLAGSSLGFNDGVGTAARFNQPYGVAVDTNGNVYVADNNNHKIRLIYPNRSVITIAGSTLGSTDGIGTAAQFNQPNGVAIDYSTGTVFVVELNNHKIRQIFSNRSVYTLSGGGSSGTLSGAADGIGTAALFNGPRGIAVSESSNVIVADSSNFKIRLVYPFTCSPGTFANFTSRSCIMCLPGSFSSASMATSCSPCAAGTFAKPYGATSCEVCPGGHACPPGTSSWARLNCGRGNYCPEGSAEPIPCPIQIVPVPYASWASHPLTAQGPAFLVETSACLNHCFWNFTSGDGMLSKC
jgi:hypothetical protein